MNVKEQINQTGLQCAAFYGNFDLAKVLIQNGADVSAVSKDNMTALHKAAKKRHVDFAKVLIQNGAVIDKKAFETDRTGLLEKINNRMNLLRAGKRIGTSLMSDEERRYMWNLAFSLTTMNPAAAFKAYYTIRSFITFHGIFMADGYDDFLRL